MAQGLIAWAFLRITVILLSRLAGLPNPVVLEPTATIALLGSVAGATWLGLRRRNLLILLPNLGLSVAAALAMATTGAAIAEGVLAALSVR